MNILADLEKVHNEYEAALAKVQQANRKSEELLAQHKVDVESFEQSCEEDLKMFNMSTGPSCGTLTLP